MVTGGSQPWTPTGCEDYPGRVHLRVKVSGIHRGQGLAQTWVSVWLLHEKPGSPSRLTFLSPFAYMWGSCACCLFLQAVVLERFGNREC